MTFLIMCKISYYNIVRKEMKEYLIPDDLLNVLTEWRRDYTHVFSYFKLCIICCYDGSILVSHLLI